MTELVVQLAEGQKFRMNREKLVEQAVNLGVDKTVTMLDCLGIKKISGQPYRQWVRTHSERGRVSLRRSRRTGHEVGIYNAKESEMEDPDCGNWATVCEAHHTLVYSETRANADLDGDDFCDDCREEMGAKA
jgi:hypothetical protein